MNEVKQARVLVVDGDAQARALARSALASCGLEVHEAAHAAEGLALADRLHPDLVVLEAALPDQDGFEVCEALRATPHLADRPIIMIARGDDLDSVRRSFEVGASDFCKKPAPWLILAQRALALLRAHRRLDALRDSRRELEHAQRIAMIGSFGYDAGRDSLRMSEGARSVVAGLPLGAITLDDLLELVHESDRHALRATFEIELSPDETCSLDFRTQPGEKAQRFIRVSVQGGPEPDSLRGILQDVTEQVHAGQQIRFLEYHDSLTQLGNRQMFKERLALALERAESEGGHVGVIVLDLDGFKRVNETFGHEVGDRLLCAVANRLRGCVRLSDTLTRTTRVDVETSIARLGSDDFTLTLEGLREPEDIDFVAERIALTLPEPIRIGSNEFTVTGSMGLATAPRDGRDVETLIRKADVAMYQAKARGPGRHVFYSEEGDCATKARVELEARLVQALDREELSVYYQPLVRAGSLELVGVEALARWLPTDGAPVPPDVFIPLAEEMGCIDRLGRAVLTSAVRQAKRWHERGMPVQVSVNLSPQQIHAELPQTLASALAEAGLPTSALVCELTESQLLRDEHRVLPVLHALRELGVGLAMDDFGTGFSSLSYLRHYPFDRLKIDRSFVRELETSPEDRSLITAIVLMGKALDLCVVAEGVETKWQSDFLLEQGCEVLQGYLHGKPMSPADLSAAFERGAFVVEAGKPDLDA